MEYRRRSLSSDLDEDLEEPYTRRRDKSASSIDDQLDQYAEYLYNGTFSVARFLCGGFLNLIKDCLRCKSGY